MKRGLAITTLVIVVLMAPRIAVSAQTNPLDSLGDRDGAEVWLSDAGLTISSDGPDLVGTMDGLEVRMGLEDDRLVRSDLAYTTAGLLDEQAVRDVVFRWRDDWAAEADPYTRWVFGRMGSFTDIVSIGHQVPMSDRTYGIDLFDLGDAFALEAAERPAIDEQWHREWVAIRPTGARVIDARMTTADCRNGEFPVEIGSGPMHIDYRVDLEVDAPGSAWLILSITPIAVPFGEDIGVTRDGEALPHRRVGEGAVAIPLPSDTKGPETFTLDLGLADSFFSHEARLVVLPDSSQEPSTDDLLTAVASAGFGWGVLLKVLCAESAGPMPPASGPIGF